MPEVVGQVYGGHAARAELAVHRVAIRERQAEPVLEIGHEISSLWRRNLP
jgi:hypothetical protein